MTPSDEKQTTGDVPDWQRRMDRFYGGEPTAEERAAPGFEPVCFIHIPKTGGTRLAHTLAYNVGKGLGPKDLFYCRHRMTDESVRQTFGQTCRIALVLRDPVDRFVSAFYSRLNEGKPFYHSPLEPNEIPFFKDYPTIDALTSALGSFRKARRQRASRGIKDIFLLTRSYARYFGHIEVLDRRAGDILACLPLDELDARTGEFMRAIGFDTYDEPEEKRPNTGPPRPDLTLRQRRVLQKYLTRDYDFFDRLRIIGERLHGA